LVCETLAGTRAPSVTIFYRFSGVLTKPDRIPEGEGDRWMKLIKNKSSVLQNGWYCVKQPSTVELQGGITFQEARRLGESFFKDTPWTTLEMMYQKRLGTQALKQKLNEYLMTVIATRFCNFLDYQPILTDISSQISGTYAGARNYDPEYKCAASEASAACSQGSRLGGHESHR